MLISNLQATRWHPPVAQHQVIALQTARGELKFEVVEGFEGPGGPSADLKKNGRG